jgi:hypothetical protein
VHPRRINKDAEPFPRTSPRTYVGTLKRFIFNNLKEQSAAWTQSYLAHLPRHHPGNHSLILYCVILLSGSMATVAKKDTYIPSRRTGKGPLGAKVFSYYTQDERQLVEKAAKLEHRSLSSFVAIAAVERAQRVLGRN